jgi:hypothetical protein
MEVPTRIPGKAEERCLRLFSEVLGGTRCLRRHRFDFLRGDPTPARPKGVALPVDGFFPDFKLVVEYMGEQHFRPNLLMNRRAGRAEKRARYQELRTTILPQNGLKLIRVRFDEPPTRETVERKLAAVGIAPSH